jgi:hypothetical protein
MVAQVLCFVNHLGGTQHRVLSPLCAGAQPFNAQDTSKDRTRLADRTPRSNPVEIEMMTGPWSPHLEHDQRKLGSNDRHLVTLTGNTTHHIPLQAGVISDLSEMPWRAKLDGAARLGTDMGGKTWLKAFTM